MADEVRPNPNSHERAVPPRDKSGPTAEERLAANLPHQERKQPDPALQLSVGRVGAGGITLVAVACAIIIAVVLWGLNSPAPNAQDVNTAASSSANPPGPGTSGAGTPNPQPSNNANAKGKG
jgi:hypothetical protein